MVGDWLISTGAAMPSGVVKGRDVKIKEIYHHHIILYSQSGIEHVHVQYKTYKEKEKKLKSTQIIDNFPYRLFRICIIIV